MDRPSHISLVFILLLFSQELFAESLAQKIYELEKGVICQNTTKEELDDLVQLSCQKNESGLKVDLNLISEKILFDKIADDEIQRISCHQTQLSSLLNDENLLKKASEQSCYFLPFLEKALQDKYFYDDLLTGVNKILKNTDLRLSPNQIEELTAKKSGYETKLRESSDIIQLVKSKDVLLSSSSLYEKISLAVTGISSGKFSKENLCEFMKRSMKQSLQKDLDKNEQIKTQISNSIKKNGWGQDTDLKAYLWASPSKHEFLSEARHQGANFKGLECIMEGKYGYGRDRVNSLKDAGYFVGSFLLPELRLLGRLGVNAYAISSTILARTAGAGEALSWWAIRDIARYESIMAKAASLKAGETIAQVGLTAAATAQSIHECFPKIQAMKGSNLCSNTSFPENFNKIQSANNCLLSATMTIITAIAPVLGNVKNTTPAPSGFDTLSNTPPTFQATRINELALLEKNRPLYSAQTQIKPIESRWNSELPYKSQSYSFKPDRLPREDMALTTNYARKDLPYLKDPVNFKNEFQAKRMQWMKDRPGEPHNFLVAELEMPVQDMIENLKKIKHPAESRAKAEALIKSFEAQKALGFEYTNTNFLFYKAAELLDLKNPTPEIVGYRHKMLVDLMNKRQNSGRGAYFHVGKHQGLMTKRNTRPKDMKEIHRDLAKHIKELQDYANTPEGKIKLLEIRQKSTPEEIELIDAALAGELNNKIKTLKEPDALINRSWELSSPEHLLMPAMKTQTTEGLVENYLIGIHPVEYPKAFKEADGVPRSVAGFAHHDIVHAANHKDIRKLNQESRLAILKSMQALPDSERKVVYKAMYEVVHETSEIKEFKNIQRTMKDLSISEAEAKKLWTWMKKNVVPYLPADT